MSTMTLQLPMNYVEVERDEMEYVDGGGTISITLSYGFIAGLVARAGTGYALTAALVAFDAGLAAAIELGTAGWGTLFAAMASAAFGAMIPTIVGLITRGVVNGIYNGGALHFNLTGGPLCPNFNLNV